jgi:hypothetical protein
MEGQDVFPFEHSAIISAVPWHTSTHRHNHTQPEELLAPSCNLALPLDFTLSCEDSWVLGALLRLWVFKKHKQKECHLQGCIVKEIQNSEEA